MSKYCTTDFQKATSKAELSTDESDEMAWINRFLQKETPMSEDEIKSILYFSLLWNLFEGLVCDNSASPRSLEAAVQKLQTQGTLNIADYLDNVRLGWPARFALGS